MLRCLSLLILIIVSFSLSAEDKALALSLKELLHAKVGLNETKGIFYESANPPTSKTINIALVIPYSHEVRVSTEYIAAAEFAASEINSMGGINGKKLVIVRVDDSTNNDSDVSLIKTLVKDFSINAVIGPWSSQRLIKVAEAVFIPENIPVVAPASNANKISNLKDRDLVFRLVPTNNQIVEKMSSHFQKSGTKKVAIFHHRDLFGSEISDELREKLGRTQTELVYSKSLSELVDYSSFDLGPDIRKIKNLGVTSIAFASFPEQFEYFMKQLIAKWPGELPEILMAENANKTVQFEPSEKIKPLCIFAVVPDYESVKSKLIRGIEDTLNISKASYTSTYVYDATYLIAGALIYSDRSGLGFSTALRNITSKEQGALGHQLIKELNQTELLKPQYRFNLNSGSPDFDSNGDNLDASIRISSVGDFYGFKCNRTEASL